MLAGMLTFGLLLVIATVAPARGAAALSVTVQVVLPGALTVPGEQVRPLITRLGVRTSVAVWLAPLSVAVTITFSVLFTVPVEAVKFVLLWPAVNVTLEGTVSAALPLARATEVATAAGLFKVTVQLLLALLPSVEGVQERLTKVAGALAVSVNVCVLLPSVAVSNAVWSEATAATVAVNPAAV
jgi:hypothetical protein